MTGRTDSRNRLLFLLVAFAFALAALAVRTGYWQLIERDRLATAARQQTELTFTEPSRRGTVYDRTGTVILATTLDRSRLIASPNQLTHARRDAVADELVEVLGLAGDAAATLHERMRKDTGYVVLADDFDEREAERIRGELRARGIAGAVGLESYVLRSYPLAGGGDGTSLASYLLGFVNSDGKGQYGVEQAYQEQLAGQPRVVLAERDAAGRPLYGTETVVDEGVAGADLTLTIDSVLQSRLEQEVFSAWALDHAKRVSAVVMDPYTGEIYAQASYPGYDANRYRVVAARDPNAFRDPVISQVYEPGSVFKMLTAAAALEKGVVTPTTKVNDGPVLTLDRGRARVTNADRKGKGWITFEDAIAYSRNIVAAKVAMKLGTSTRQAANVLYRTWTRFGFGSRTGIDLAGEETGILKDPSVKDWREIDLANGSFGQSVAVTPIQLVTAFAAMVNGGTLIRPRVVKAVGDNAVVPEPGTQVIPAAQSRQLVDLMEHVIKTVPFYRSRTLVPGYVVGGKTGTAQIWDKRARGGKGDWKPNTFNFSFVGYIGKDTPRLVVGIEINEGKPTINKPGDILMPVMSFELFRRIGTEAMRTLDLPAVGDPLLAAASR